MSTFIASILFLAFVLNIIFFFLQSKINKQNLNTHEKHFDIQEKILKSLIEAHESIEKLEVK